MSLVLAAIVITIFAAIFIPPYINPPHDNFQASVSENTSQSLTLHLTINSTVLAPNQGLNVSAWAISTSPSINNVSAADAWGVSQFSLFTRPCSSSLPIGVGVMEGHYDDNNYSLGTFVKPIYPLVPCPLPVPAPAWYAFEPGSSNAIISVLGQLGHTSISTSWVFSGNSALGFGGQLKPGVYTAVLADEWGDVLTTNFAVT